MRTIKLHFLIQRQRGLTLMIVLIALVSLSLAAVALIRSVDTGSLVMGNLGFKQGATSSTDNSVEAAMTWISGKLGTPTELYDSRCSSGCTTQDNNTAYYATSLDALDISGHSPAANRVLIDWDNNNCSYATAGTFISCLKASQVVSANGYRTSYVIARMCKTIGDPNLATNNCAQSTSAGGSGGAGGRQINKGETKYGATTMFGGSGGAGGGTGGGATTLVFRIIVRSQGPRNTVSYIESFVSTVAS